jgi:hypothetical protein
MSSLPVNEPSGKGLWLASSEIEALTAAEEAAKGIRSELAVGLPEGDGAHAAAVMQAQVLKASSWRARLLALAAAILQPDVVDPQSLAFAILQEAPAARASTVPDGGTLSAYDEAARRFFARASAAEQAGSPTLALSTDEAREFAISLLDLVEAVRDLA